MAARNSPRRDGANELGLDPELETDPAGGFSIELDAFAGPFDLLLRLISRHELDIVDISLSRVTDDFIAYVRQLDVQGQLDEGSQFILIAATLLDIKIAELLPRGEVVDPEDVALLEARDLLFARLLQYRAFKEVAGWFAMGFETAGLRHSRQVALDKEHRVPPQERDWSLSPADFAGLAMLAFAPKDIPIVAMAHLIAPQVSIREQAALLVGTLRRKGKASFGELIADAVGRGEIVARFIAVLELYRGQAVTFEQLEPLGPLHVTWIARNWSDENLAVLGSEYEGGHEHEGGQHDD